jgi:HEAT repeat protein
MLTSGVLRAIGRVGPINNETVGYAIPNILPYLKSENSTVRGNAAFALGELGAIGAVVSLKSLLDDKGNVLFYKDRELQETTVGDLARKAVEKLEAVVG